MTCARRAPGSPSVPVPRGSSDVATPVAPPDTAPRETGDVTVDGGVGESVLRPDGTLKVQGAFAYSSDLQAERMLWGATVRSPHPHARIRSIEIGRALATPGVDAA